MKGNDNSEWLVVVNPNAGVGKGKKDWKAISALLGRYKMPYRPVFTERRLHAMQMVEDHIRKGFRKILVVGGDGTMNEAVNGILNQSEVPSANVTLAMISVGTGNDWVRTYGIPTDYNKVIPIVKKEETMLQDAGVVKYQQGAETISRYFINMAGLGFDGFVAQKTNRDKDLGKSNPFLYFKNLIASLFAYKACQTKVFVDGKEYHDKFFSIGIGIGQYNGGGMHQAPGALTDDGLFDLVLIKDMSKLKVVASIHKLYNGTIGEHKRVVTTTGRSIRIESDPPVFLETDGESLGHSPFEFEIIPKSIRVVVNQS